MGPFPICLPLRYAPYNLLSDVRAQALERFARYDIRWHNQTAGPSGERWPSTHLLDSQVQCANVLLSLDPDQLLSLVREAEPEAVRLVPIEDDHPVAFEWNGLRDYLGEGRGRPRRRGQFCTSADALLVAERKSGRTAILVEWKYTETYDEPVSVHGKGGTDRRTVYRDRYEAAPFLHRPPVDAFLHEPHYQLLRQALLGHGMVEAREHGVDRVVLLHVMPAQNRTLLATVPEELAEFGETVPAV